MSFDQEGWKDYLTIYVNNGQITIVEYDARNLSGFRRSWDMDRMLAWNSTHGVRPSRYLLSYQNALLTLQDPRRIQPLPGGRNMYESFTALAEAAIGRSRSGESQVAFVRLQEKRHPGEL
jgi:major membrane immunogen (membrane-anchored lipoprotein)